MTRRRGLAIAIATVVILGTPNAWAQVEPPSNGGINDGNLDTTAGQSGNTPGVTPVGSPNTPSNGGGSTVFTPPPECRYIRWLTGPAMAAYAAAFVVPMYPAPPTGWEAHATDLEGSWYRPNCVFTSGIPDRLTERAEAFARDNPPVWGSTEPPPPPIPVVDLVEIVQDRQRLPSLVVSTNPTGQSVVGLRTWVWPTGGDFGAVTSRAQSGPNWAQVTATPGQLSLTSTDPGAEVGGCATAPAWSAGADDEASDCYVSFRRSSAGRPGDTHTVNVSMTWQVRLTTSDGRNELLESPPVVTPVPLPVAQVQSVLR